MRSLSLWRRLCGWSSFLQSVLRSLLQDLVQWDILGIQPGEMPSPVWENYNSTRAHGLFFFLSGTAVSIFCQYDSIPLDCMSEMQLFFVLSPWVSGQSSCQLLQRGSGWVAGSRNIHCCRAQTLVWNSLQANAGYFGGVVKGFAT